MATPSARDTIVIELGDIFFLIRPRVDEDRRNGFYLAESRVSQSKYHAPELVG
jgi:hypothetical protein